MKRKNIFSCLSIISLLSITAFFIPFKTASLPMLPAPSRQQPSSFGLAVRWTYLREQGSPGAPVIVDLDLDGTKEIIVGMVADYVHDPGALYCINFDGSMSWLFPTNRSISASPTIARTQTSFGIYFCDWHDFFCINDVEVLQWVFEDSYGSNAAASLVDLDQNGSLEVLHGDLYSRMYCLSNNGTELWCHRHPDTEVHFQISGSAIGDLDGDNHAEILVSMMGDLFYCLNYNGSLKWTVYASGGTEFSPASLGDLNADGSLEILFTDWWGGVHCLNASGAPQWSHQISDDISGSVALADLTGDGQLEVVAGSEDGKLSCLTATGSMLWSYDTGGAIRCTPTIADLNNDTHLEIVFSAFHAPPRNATVYCLDHSGALLCSLDVHDTAYGGGTNSIADLDGDGIFEIIGCCGPTGLIYCLELTGVAASGIAPWPTLQGSFFRTGWGDSDGDLLDDFTEEWSFQTDPQNPDSDDDSYSDGEEYYAGTDPLDPSSFPQKNTPGLKPALLAVVVLAPTIFIGSSIIAAVVILQRRKKRVERRSD